MPPKSYYQAAKSSLTGNPDSKLAVGLRAIAKTLRKNLEPQADATKHVDFEDLLSRLSTSEKNSDK